MYSKTIKRTPFLVRQQLANFKQYSGHHLLEVKYGSKVISRLVNNLTHVLNIQYGNHLTFVLGFGECSNNKVALQKWVKSQLPIASDLDETFKNLKSLLKNQLSQKEIL